MNSLSILKSRQVGLFAAAGALLLALILPTIASAAQLTSRSVALSSSSINATNVSYTLEFTAATAAQAFVVEFCQNSPLIGAACTAPAGLNATAAASASNGVTGVTGSTNKIVVEDGISAADNVSVEFTGLTNPSVVGPIYARIVTYDTVTNANAYVSAAIGSGVRDQGSAAISITNTIGVSAAVLESMTFCVSKNQITPDCANVVAPVLQLGEVTGSVVALSANAVSEGNLYTQISTNAVTGAVVSLKSNAFSCGGFLRAGADPTACDIKPALTGGIAAGDAKFGVKTEAATNATGASNPNGDFLPSGIYGPGAFALNYVVGNLTGITSPYGDAFLNTDGKPVNNKNVKLTFGASINNSTPAGLYTVDLGMIATGKF